MSGRASTSPSTASRPIPPKPPPEPAAASGADYASRVGPSTLEARRLVAHLAARKRRLCASHRFLAEGVPAVTLGCGGRRLGEGVQTNKIAVPATDGKFGPCLSGCELFMGCDKSIVARAAAVLNAV